MSQIETSPAILFRCGLYRVKGEKHVSVTLLRKCAWHVLWDNLV